MNNGARASEATSKVSPGVPACPAERMDLITGMLQSLNGQDEQEAETRLVDILLNDPDSIVRHEAAFVLGELHERGVVSGEQALPALCRVAVSDKSIVARHEAAESLACFPGPVAEAVLGRLLDDPHPDIAATANAALRWLQQSAR